jgi:hypothetical protein
LWSNLPAGIGAGQITELYRTRWRIEGVPQTHTERSSP